MKKYKMNFLKKKLKSKSPTEIAGNNHRSWDKEMDKGSSFHKDNNELYTKINNKDDEVYSNIFEKNTMDLLLQDELKKTMLSVKTSHNLRESILEHTTKKPQSLYEKLSNFLNKTVEIPVSFAYTFCIVLFISSTLSTFIVTDSMKTNKKLQGYTSIRVLSISGSNVILPKDMSEVISNEEN